MDYRMTDIVNIALIILCLLMQTFVTTFAVTTFAVTTFCVPFPFVDLASYTLCSFRS